MISPLAYIHPEAKIGENVEIGPFVFIDKNVVIGDNNTIMPNVNILYGSRTRFFLTDYQHHRDKNYSKTYQHVSTPLDRKGILAHIFCQS